MSSKRWCFTLNNPDLEEVCCFNEWIEDPDKVVYAVIADEVGESGTHHIQGFVVFKRMQRLSAVKKLIPRAHLEPARGTSLEAGTYCKKDGKYAEYGVCPRDTRVSSEDNISRWDDARALARAGKFDEIESQLYIRYRNAFHAIHEEAQQATECIAVLDHLWIYGGTGIGKSRYVWDNYPGHYRKPVNKWYDHYNGEDVVVIEDIDPSHEKWLGYFLKIWSDHYPYIAERKGGSMCIRPKKIIVTSNFLISDVFSADGIKLPLLRRFKEMTIVDGVLTDLTGMCLKGPIIMVYVTYIYIRRSRS